MDESHRQITKIAREVEKFTVRTLKADGVGAGELDLIHTVRENPGITQAGISKQLGTDKGAVARQTLNLEEKGYLHRKPNPAEGRSRLIFPTEKAQQLKGSKAHIEAVFYGWLLEELEPEERARFTQLLEKLYLRCKAESKAGFPTMTARIRGEK